MLVGVVVLYNPQSLTVINNINSYLENLDRLLIVDNSEVYNEEVLNFYKANNKVKYEYLGQNMGIAFALNKGIDFAKLNNASMLLTMDQDSSFKSSEFIKFKNFLREKASLYNDAIIFSPRQNVPYLDGKLGIEKVNSVMTSGNVILLGKINEIGYFDEKLFIDSVDHEFCFRIKKHGYGVYRINDIKLEHNLGEIETKKFFNKKLYVTNHNYIRRYYITRNLFYVMKIYSNSNIRFLKFAISNLFWSILSISLFETDKLLKIRSIFMGLKDFKRGKLGKKSF